MASTVSPIDSIYGRAQRFGGGRQGPAPPDPPRRCLSASELGEPPSSLLPRVPGRPRSTNLAAFDRIPEPGPTRWSVVPSGLSGRVWGGGPAASCFPVVRLLQPRTPSLRRTLAGRAPLPFGDAVGRRTPEAALRAGGPRPWGSPRVPHVSRLQEIPARLHDLDCVPQNSRAGGLPHPQDLRHWLYLRMESLTTGLGYNEVSRVTPDPLGLGSL